MKIVKRILVTVLFATLLTYIVLVAVSVHGDGVRRPEIIVTVTDQKGNPVADVSVAFLDIYCLYWCRKNSVDPDKLLSNPPDNIIELLQNRNERAKTDLKGHAVVKGFFPTAHYLLWGEKLRQTGEMVFVLPGYKTECIQFDDKKNRFRTNIIKGRVELDVVMKERLTVPER